jgi:hypothetical protein
MSMPNNPAIKHSMGSRFIGTMFDLLEDDVAVPAVGQSKFLGLIYL